MTPHENYHTTPEVLRPLREDYAEFDEKPEDRDRRTMTSFDWSSEFENLNIPIGKKVIAYFFRSRRNPNVDMKTLLTFDSRALLAAGDSGGLILYKAFEEGLSICLWESEEDALRATSSPEHREAVGYAPHAYEEYELTCWEAGRPTEDSDVEFVLLWRHGRDFTSPDAACPAPA